MIWLGLVFVAAFIGAGWPLWLTPYSQITLPNTWFMPVLLVIGPLAAGMRLTEIAGLRSTAVILTAAMLGANVARIAVDTGLDPTSHNLFPFELVITMITGIVASLVGYLVGLLLHIVVSADRG